MFEIATFFIFLKLAFTGELRNKINSLHDQESASLQTYKHSFFTDTMCLKQYSDLCRSHFKLCESTFSSEILFFVLLLLLLLSLLLLLLIDTFCFVKTGSHSLCIAHWPDCCDSRSVPQFPDQYNFFIITFSSLLFLEKTFDPD